MFVKNEKGITLISLVVTIVIMVILAGVSIRYVVSTSLIDRTVNLNDKNMISSLVDEWNNRRALIEVKGNIPATEMNYDNLKNINLFLTEAYDDVSSETKYSEKLIQNTVLTDEYNKLLVIVDGEIRYIEADCTPQQKAVFEELKIPAFDDDGTRWFASVIDISGKNVVEDVGLHHHTIGDEEPEVVENTVTHEPSTITNTIAIGQYTVFDKIVPSKFEYKDTFNNGLLLEVEPQETENMKMVFSIKVGKQAITADMFIRIFPSVAASQNESDLLRFSKSYIPANKKLRLVISNLDGLTFSNPNQNCYPKIYFYNKNGAKIGDEVKVEELLNSASNYSVEYTNVFPEDVYGIVVKIHSLTKISGRVDVSISYEN